MSQDEGVSSSESDRRGASRTTGGLFRGNATGNVLNWGDASMCFYMLFFSAVYFFPSDDMDVDTQNDQQSVGKVLLYTSQERNDNPAMTMKLQTTTELPSVLDKLAQKFSPIRSKYIIFYQSNNS